MSYYDIACRNDTGLRADGYLTDLGTVLSHLRSVEVEVLGEVKTTGWRSPGSPATAGVQHLRVNHSTLGETWLPNAIDWLRTEGGLSSFSWGVVNKTNSAKTPVGPRAIAEMLLAIGRVDVSTGGTIELVRHPSTTGPQVETQFALADGESWEWDAYKRCSGYTEESDETETVSPPEQTYGVTEESVMFEKVVVGAIPPTVYDVETAYASSTALSIEDEVTLDGGELSNQVSGTGAAFASGLVPYFLAGGGIERPLDETTLIFAPGEITGLTDPTSEWRSSDEIPDDVDDGSSGTDGTYIWLKTDLSGAKTSLENWYDGQDMISAYQAFKAQAQALVNDPDAWLECELRNPLHPDYDPDIEGMVLRATGRVTGYKNLVGTAKVTPGGFVVTGGETLTRVWYHFSGLPLPVEYDYFGGLE